MKMSIEAKPVNLDPPTPDRYLAMTPEERERDFERACRNIRLKVAQVKRLDGAA